MSRDVHRALVRDRAALGGRRRSGSPRRARTAQLRQALEVIQTRLPGARRSRYEPRGPWTRLTSAVQPEDDAATGVPVERLARDCTRAHRRSCPPDFKVHPKIARSSSSSARDGRRGEAADRLGTGRGARLRHACAVEGTPVRLSGQDARARHVQPPPRGARRPRRPATSVRAARTTLRRDQAPLRGLRQPALGGGGARLRVRLQPRPTRARSSLWEAQFGDFANGAQVIIDQFIAAAEAKWEPHVAASCCCCRTATRGRARSTRARGSSASCSSCAEDNIQVVQLHDAGAVLPRAAAPDAPLVPRKPLIVITPKSLLRHQRRPSGSRRTSPGAASSPVLDDGRWREPARVRRARARAPARSTTTCWRGARTSRTTRTGRGRDRARRAALSVPGGRPARRARALPARASVVWVQEEPENMGAWTFVRERLREHLGAVVPLAYAGRPRAPARPSARRACIAPSRPLSWPRAFEGLGRAPVGRGPRPRQSARAGAMASPVSRMLSRTVGLADAPICIRHIRRSQPIDA